MVVNKSSATNNTTPAAKEKYAASTMTLATVRLFVMTITSHRGRTIRRLLPSAHPPQLKPMIIVTAAPAAAPCKRRVSESPCRIEGSSMTSPFDERNASRKQQRA